MTGREPFRPDELEGADGIGSDALAAESRVARDLEAAASRSGVTAPTTGFADRVMAAVAAEPLPAPARAAGSALRHGAFAALLVSIRDAFRVSFSGGFPALVRAQALALVLIVVVLGGGAAYGAAAAAGILDASPPPVQPSPVQPSPSDLTDPTPSLPPTPSPSPSPVPEITTSPEPGGVRGRRVGVALRNGGTGGDRGWWRVRRR